MLNTTIYVEILPDVWRTWQNCPTRVRAGRIRKRQPAPHERHLFTEVVLWIDPVRYDRLTT